MLNGSFVAWLDGLFSASHICCYEWCAAVVMRLMHYVSHLDLLALPTAEKT